MDGSLFEYLLSRPETKIIDFKVETYDFSKNRDHEDAKLVKDILSFANTIRTETAYIIAGVKINQGKKELLGITGMLDDASLQQKVKSKIQLTPHFLSYDFHYQGKVFGIIEIPVHPYKQPLWATVPLKGCEISKVYHRVGTSNTEVKAGEFLAIIEWLEKLSGASLPPPTKPVIEPLEHYIQRTVTSAGGDTLSQFLLDPDPLEKALENHKKVALLGWGLSGKTTELKRVGHLLSLKEDNYVYLIPFKDHTDEPIVSHIPHIDRINPANLFVLLDGLDEVLPAEFETARRHIGKFVHDYPEATVVVSCRTNFYVTDPNDNGLGTLTNFESYRLNNLKPKDVDCYLDEKYPKDKTAFLQEVSKKKLNELLAVPYYLVKFSDQFKLHRKIPGSKAELFGIEIKVLIAKDIAKIEHTGREVYEKRLFNMFKELAFIMEAKGTNTLSTNELAEIFPNRSDLSLVMSAGSVFFGTDGTQKIWRFNHNNTQEYLAAIVLVDLTFVQIKRIIGNRPDYHRIKPSWVNTLSFLNSILGPDAPLKYQITNWIVKCNRELAILLDPENITNEFRYKVFTEIFNDFKRKKRQINRNFYRIEDLARFSECIAVFDFLLLELKRHNNNACIANILNIINHYELQRYPEYQDAFKPHYHKYLFKDQSEHQYLALVGFVSLFNLTKDEFEEVFEKLRDNDNTWIRYQLFMGIWLTNSQDRLLDYVLEQARFLLAEDRLDKRRNNNEMRLTNEYREITNCLKRINSVKALTQLFIEIKKDFLVFKHSIYFEKIFDSVLDKAAKYPTDTMLFNAIDDLFLEYHHVILHDNLLKSVFPRYYKMTGRVDAILDLLYSKKEPADYSVRYTIGAMAEPAFIDYLFQKHQAGQITSEYIKTVHRSIKLYKNPNEVYFSRIFSLSEKSAEVVRDFRKEEEDNHRNLAALFDKNGYLFEIRKIFDAFGKNTLTNEDRYSNEDPDYWGPEFCEVAREALELHAHGTAALWEDISASIEKNFEIHFINRIYEYIVKHSEVKLSDAQRNHIILWCDQQVKLVKFKGAITQKTALKWKWKIDALILSFFIRLLNLSHYEDDIYLDMLSFLKDGDSIIDITAFVEETIGVEKTRIRILENLNSGIFNGQIIKAHVDFLVRHELTEAVNLLIPYFQSETSVDRHQLLKVYVDLKGDIEKLYFLLDQSDHYFRNSLIEQFLRKESSTIRTYLKEKFVAEKDGLEKLNFSKYLIRLQDLKALKYYVNYLKQANSVPDDSSPVNPLYSLREKRFTWTILNLYEIAQQPQFHSDSFSDLRSICSIALQNIALNNGNFPYVKQRIILWIMARKLINKFKPMPINLLKDIEFLLENFDRQFYVTNVVMLSQQEAMELYHKIAKK
ncbi:RNA-binding domain-containing protein [[Flexibacter] sp. ATCC 35208]|uniref:RNA-binding domain-containing protein n=1 Tax=[Flexibacter] sp. ATCC 35208 TaxID=1936242 RepID=UPI0009D6279E|nr:RNA-binding domain-containing protein [[Flexibacter] sp. ATCC 35208]OMP76270.1 hypothetical protein BW716_25660 [[Flexibacter] sp. ATCC 35208]